MRAVVKEAKCATTRSRIVNNFSHHCARLVKEKLVSNTNLTCRLNQYVPKTHLLVQLTKKEYLNLSISLLLCSIQTSRENLSVIEDKCIALIEVIEHIFEADVVFYVSNTCAAQCCKIGSAIHSSAKIACQCADISTFTADYTD